jgi:hypothetical protein
MVEKLKASDGIPCIITETVSLSPDYRLLLHCTLKLRFSTELRGVDWSLVTNVSGSISILLNWQNVCRIVICGHSGHIPLQKTQNLNILYGSKIMGFLYI